MQLRKSEFCLVLAWDFLDGSIFGGVIQRDLVTKLLSLQVLPTAVRKHGLYSDKRSKVTNLESLTIKCLSHLFVETSKILGVTVFN